MVEVLCTSPVDLPHFFRYTSSVESPVNYLWIILNVKKKDGVGKTHSYYHDVRYPRTCLDFIKQTVGHKTRVTLLTQNKYKNTTKTITESHKAVIEHTHNQRCWRSHTKPKHERSCCDARRNGPAVIIPVPARRRHTWLAPSSGMFSPIIIRIRVVIVEKRIKCRFFPEKFRNISDKKRVYSQSRNIRKIGEIKANTFPKYLTFVWKTIYIKKKKCSKLTLW